MELSEKFALLNRQIKNKYPIDPSSILELLSDVFAQEKMYSYSIHNGQLIVTEKDKDIFLTNTIIVPIADKRLQHLDTNKRVLEVVGIRDGKELLERISLTANDISNSPNWLKNKWGFKSRIFPGDSYTHIKNSIGIVCQYIPEIVEYSYIGWAKDRAGIFLTGSGPIGKLDKNTEITVSKELSQLRLRTGYHDEIEPFDFIINKMLKIGPPSITYTALSFSLLSLLTSVLAQWEYKPQFVYYLYGVTGSKKTSISKVFFNILSKYEQSVPINFTATLPALKAKSIELRDVVCLFDDLAPSVNPVEAHALQVKLEQIIRSYGDSIGSQKMAESKKKIYEQSPGGLAAITAESNAISSISSIARCFLVNIGIDDINLKTLTYVQQNREMFTTAIHDYIVYITEDFSNFINKFKTTFLENKKFFEDCYMNIHPRLIMNSAFLHTSFVMFLDYGKDRNFIDKDSRKNLIRENKDTLKQLLAEQNIFMQQENEITLFFSAINELLNGNKVFLLSLEKDGKRQIAEHNSKAFSQLIGYEDKSKNFIYLLRNTTYNLVYSFYKRQGKNFPVSERTLVDTLHKKGLLKTDQNHDGAKTVRINVNGKRVSVIRLERDKFYSFNDDVITLGNNDEADF